MPFVHTPGAISSWLSSLDEWEASAKATLDWFKRELEACEGDEPWPGCRDSIRHLEQCFSRSTSSVVPSRVIDEAEVELFFALLDKDQVSARIRGIGPRFSRKDDATIPAIQYLQSQGCNVYAVINDGGDRDAEISSCRTLFCEWDDRPKDWQRTAWQELGLPEPSFMVDTSGKSIHCYWVLDEQIGPDQWRVLQRRLLEHADADRSLCNPSRLMRLPGCHYLREDGTSAGISRIVAASNQRYSVGDLERCLPPAKTLAPKPAQEQQSSVAQAHALGIPTALELAELLPRGMTSLLEQGASEGNRNASAFSLATSALAIAEAARAAGLQVRGDAESLLYDFAAHCTPPLPEREAQRCLQSALSQPRMTDPGWPERLRYQLNRLQGGKLQKPARKAPRSQPQKFTPREDTEARWGKRSLSHCRSMACFERCVAVQAARERNSIRRRVRLMKAARDLGLNQFIKGEEVSQLVLAAKDQQQGNSYKALSAADRLAMEWPEVDWLVPDLIPANDLSIIGGRPKVGKTAVAMAIAAAVLTGREVLGCAVSSQTRPVIVISDDQGDSDTKHSLCQLGIFSHPSLIWSRRFRLSEFDLDELLKDVDRNPGALVIMDSLRSVSRSLPHGENDPEIGAVIYDLKAAVTAVGGTLLLVHHCNKAAGLTGVEALSGHNAIAGAANTVLTMHYLEDEKGRPLKQLEQRRFVREARSGGPLDVVISRTVGTGTFHRIKSYEQWQQDAEQARKDARREASQTTTQLAILDLLENKPEQWFTCREVVEGLGLKWGGRGNDKDAVRVRDALNCLCHEGDLERQRSGNAHCYRLASDCESSSPGAQNESAASASSAPLQDEGSQCRDQSSATSALSEQDAVAEAAETVPLQRDPLQRNGAEVAEAVEASSSPALLDEPHSSACALLIGSGAEVMDDEDDPSWGPRPEGLKKT